ncbi:uncharacterized protein PITG_08683 [Phytophthora infestans T30-4]|uniref:Uncharacterized protein n=2 Tax=Phytophthora infestans TaxID=4787 RepID=D0NCY0_PHYIT|nr:uncharacterized protein PITG_08683 [Phytophthora infestans T30-4]EEY55937.1 conserved hypothetical protein [Phytophthora infestans T30-4]KAF4135467.1 Telomere-capping CST complex subunit [Phytophthora infestans]KAI9981959.1 hypothetical protein PInf_009742 [Phytophthora infestans]|eukprot:XP_002902767.1 conserved hypothetical protein [Phytophthora infestans T30-4]
MLGTNARQLAPATTAEICQIAEVLVDPQLQNRSVRITGKLETYDAQRKVARVSFQDVSMTVETHRLALENLRLQLGSMYQFLGETYACKQGGPVEVRLVARVARNVDSLDIDLFIETLAMRRQFLASRG